MKKISSAVFVVALSSAIFFSFTNVRAANHGDGPAASNDPSADLGDLYFFLDPFPSDNSRAVLGLTMRGFIVPSEAVNMGIFDPTVVFRFLIEETGDAVPDATISVTFSPRVTTASAQVATVKMVRGANTVFEFVAPATNPSIAATAPSPVVTMDAASGVEFFAGWTIHSSSTTRHSRASGLRSSPARRIRRNLIAIAIPSPVTTQWPSP